MGIFEIFIFLIVVLIVVPPEHLPQIMRTTGKLLRELRLASNTVMRELSGALDEPPPYLNQRPPDTPTASAQTPAVSAESAEEVRPQPPAQT
ncbi:MAG: Sec-independent protein translocase subunit TatA/TatB [Candidatus Binataceae bacterium]